MKECCVDSSQILQKLVTPVAGATNWFAKSENPMLHQLCSLPPMLFNSIRIKQPYFHRIGLDQAHLPARSRIVTRSQPLSLIRASGISIRVIALPCWRTTAVP